MSVFVFNNSLLYINLKVLPNIEIGNYTINYILYFSYTNIIHMKIHIDM